MLFRSRAAGGGGAGSAGNGQGEEAGAESGTGVAAVTTMVVNYLDQLPSVRDATGEALLQLGDGNWKMGDGAPKVRCMQ